MPNAIRAHGMNIFIAGICGTFMAGIAQLARAGGHTVRGCDSGVYPPMSTLLRAQGIEVAEGYLPEHLGTGTGTNPDMADTIIIGNALSRGNPLVEHVLNENLAFCAGPEWLREHVLAQRTVIAIAGTHGKTTTSSILAWILECAGRSPGYLIGGKPGNFETSASLGDARKNNDYFVIEADEYDTAFFDKRAKFVHYRPHIAVLNNLEFDHADIFDDIGQIQKQFHHLVRTVPGNGCVVVNADDPRLESVLDMGCWSEVVRFSVGVDKGGDKGIDKHAVEWRAVPVSADGARFDVLRHGQTVARVNWECIGEHNIQNAVAAVAAAAVAGVSPAAAGEYLSGYIPADRRLQLLFQSDAVSLYDDFAHHPTAIRHTIDAVRAKHPGSRVIAVVELRSSTMRMSAGISAGISEKHGGGGHGKGLAEALGRADCAIVSGCADSPLPGLSAAQKNSGEILQLAQADEIIAAIKLRLSGNDIIITMSNGGFDGLPGRLAESLATL